MDALNTYKELKEIRAILNDIQLTLVRNTENLTYHIKRTDLQEKRIDLMEGDLLKVRGFFSIGGWILGIVATVMTIAYRLHFL